MKLVKEEEIYYTAIPERMFKKYRDKLCKFNTEINVVNIDCPILVFNNLYDTVLGISTDEVLSKCKFYRCNFTGEKELLYTGYMVDTITLLDEIPFYSVDEYIKNNIKFLSNETCTDNYSLYMSRFASLIEHGYGIDLAIANDNPFIRRMVAKQGKKLDILIHDIDWRVRLEVVNQRYGLSRLLNDEDERVRSEAEKILIAESDL